MANKKVDAAVAFCAVAFIVMLAITAYWDPRCFRDGPVAVKRPRARSGPPHVHHELGSSGQRYCLHGRVAHRARVQNTTPSCSKTGVKFFCRNAHTFGARSAFGIPSTFWIDPGNMISAARTCGFF